MLTRPKTTLAAACALAGLAVPALAAERVDPAAADDEPAAAALVDNPGKLFERSADTHATRVGYRDAHEKREKQDEAAASPESFGVSQSTLDAIAACESGGDPTAVSADGTYRGKYQFDTGTWASVGGSGDPAAAPEAEQDMRAAMLYQQTGSNPWPVCG